MDNVGVICATGFVTQFATIYVRVYGCVNTVAGRTSVLEHAYASWTRLTRPPGRCGGSAYCECGGGSGVGRSAAVVLEGSGGGVKAEVGGSGCPAGDDGRHGGLSAGCADGSSGGADESTEQRCSPVGTRDVISPVVDGNAGLGSFLGWLPNGKAQYVTEKTLQNRAKRRAKVEGKNKKKNSVPVWRRNAVPVSASVVTPPLTEDSSAGSGSSGGVGVAVRSEAEVEAAETLARRRAAENKVAEALAKHRLNSLNDKAKTDALRRLDVARVEEKINTTKAKSQASFKKCASPIESIGSALSAGEFAMKQEVRKREALQAQLDYLNVQFDLVFAHASPKVKQAVADIPEPYIPTFEEIEAMDDDVSPYLSMDQMEAEAARFSTGKFVRRASVSDPEPTTAELMARLKHMDDTGCYE